MKYIILESKVNRLVGSLVKQVFPNFSKGNCHVEQMGDSDNPEIYFFLDGKPYAKYNLWTRQLRLDRELFETLESFLGEDLMTNVIDWFNEEFDMEAESVTY